MPNNIEISKKWTCEERLKIVAKIAEQMSKSLAVQHNHELLDIRDRLTFLADGSANFLELNRDAVINGHKI